METITSNHGNKVISAYEIDNTMRDQQANNIVLNSESMGVKLKQDGSVAFVNMPCSNLCLNEYHCSTSVEVAKKKKIIIQDYSASEAPLCLGYNNNCDADIQIFKEMKTLSQYTIQCTPSGSKNMSNQNAYFLRKQNTLNENQLILVGNCPGDAEADKMNQELIAAGQQEEVLRAAKALFSKKTRTLYHWMYPNTPKFQLKTAVSMAWDTMDINEKQFYISQVLGKFGSLQNRLMINPQLGLLNKHSIKQSSNSTTDYNAVETSTAVANLLASSPVLNPSDRGAYDNRVITGSRKRGRPRSHSKSVLKLMQHDYGHMEDGEMQQSFKLRQPHNVYHQQLIKSEESLDNNLNHLEFPDGLNSYEDGYCKENLYRVQTQEDDFTDDPELRNELDKYQWNLNKRV